MTFPPSDRPTPDQPWASPQWASATPPAGRGSRRGLVVAGTVIGVLVLGGAGLAAAEYLSGGGSQPQDVLPADAFGVVTLDLDPAADQKFALLSLMEKFPDLDDGGEGDVRGRILDPLLDESGLGLDFEADVQPWLGDRMGVAAVASDDSPEGVVPVLAVSVTDEAQMADALTRAQEAGDFGFAVRDDYVLITDTQDRAEMFASAEDTLAEDADFAGDREALGGDQVVLVWADLTEAQQLLAAQGAAAGLPEAESLTGRLILGLHAEDDALELVGLDFGVSDLGVPDGEPTRLGQNLPEDTLAALAASEVGDRAVAYWEQMEDTGAFPGGEDPFAQLDLDLPDDLRTLLGTDLAVAAFGDLENPRLGLRVVTEDGDRAIDIVEDLVADPEIGLEAVPAPVDDGYVVASDRDTAFELVDDGDLGDTPAFRDAVADPDTASGIGYVDLAAVIDQLVDQGGETGEQAAKFAAVEALGFSATSTDEGGRFVLRITTR